MTDQTVGVINQTGTGTLKVDTSELVVAGSTVERQRMVIADPVGAGLLANVTAGGALKVDASTTTQPVSLAASVAVTGTFWQATQPVSGTVTANAGANLNTSALALDATLTGNNQRSRITDGANIAAVKAASTAAVATDPALVVTLSPNNPVTVNGSAGVALQQASSSNGLIITGAVADGNAPTTFSHITAGIDGGGLKRSVLTDTGGRLTINITQFGGTNLSTGTGVGGTGIPRVTVSSDSSLTANLGTLNGAATAAGQVAPLAQGSITSGQTGALIQGAVTTGVPAYTTGQTSPLSLTLGGALRVDASATTLTTQISTKATGGASIARLSTGASGVIKAGAGTLYGYNLLNTNAAVRYLQLYNKATAGVPGTDTPVGFAPIPAGGSVAFSLPPQGAAHATGIAWAITTDAPGATAGASGDIVGTAYYA